MHSQDIHTSRALRRPRSSGYVGALLMTGIATVAAIGFVANQRYQVVTRDAWIDRTTDALVLQSTVVTSAILGCGATYTKGDNGDPLSAAGAKRFPSSNARLDNVQCPGAPSNAKFILKGKDGAFVTPLPAEFSTWSFSNTAAGLSFSIQANTGAAVTAARNAAKVLGGSASVASGVLTVNISYPVLPPDIVTSTPVDPCGTPPAKPPRPPEPEKQAQWYKDYAAWESAYQAYQACLVWGPGGQHK